MTEERDDETVIELSRGSANGAVPNNRAGTGDLISEWFALIANNFIFVRDALHRAIQVDNELADNNIRVFFAVAGIDRSVNELADEIGLAIDKKRGHELIEKIIEEHDRQAQARRQHD